jgi:ubiquinone biosynthesis protein UbiJ
MGRQKKFDSQIAVLLHALQAAPEWRTLEQLASITGISAFSLSAQLRNLRKEKHGGHEIAKRRLNGSNGVNRVYEYRLETHE